ncbi:MAG: hypothetical protein A2998_02615 [Candidatus Staskawiczbacteria bacterium RIFCSPLOWO2_01_FULL_37_25b]|uniref:Uncharacterized protein n=2 Tax=Candidatus Staskawicziibacteriota TaxID=1817916 RepID=A0A1G2HTE4_9BACT|nr:MAG: hypothetical protein A2812_01990 [Candidatus Staskawiczbacteria bacterium RIFCSPHIGHO2_01_FULL_36_16]OGZ73759.1 MAG: hypothetical protein A2998_02615 [Candidatus Staskawiczbacteria bacterium RIFCSPLOWO2_01_FULL_37_25b]
MANKVFFEEDTFPIISQILEANSIKESREDVIKKISNDKPLMGEIIIDVTEKIVLENIQEKDACLFLKEQLNVTEQIAKQVYADIQKKLLPLAKKNDVETQTQEQKSITAQPTRLINENKNIDNNKKPVKIRKERPKIIDPMIEEPKEIVPKVIQKRGPDSYREPIE